MTITPDGSTAYVANTGPNTGRGGSEVVTVIDVNDDTPTGTVTVGEAPQVVTVSPDGSLVFVTCADGVYVITASNGKVRKVHDDLRDPHGVTVTPDGSQAYVADSRNDRVVVIDTTTLRRVATIGVGRTPWSTAFTADGSSAYVTNANDDTVSVIDTSARNVAQTIALGAGNHIPTAIVMSAADSAWVTGNASSSVAVIDASSNKVVETIAIGLGDGPTGIAFT